MLLDLLYAPACAACDAPCREPLCDACAVSADELGPACPLCAEPMGGPEARPCARCRAEPLPLEAIRAPFRYGGQLAVALRRLKFGRRTEVARALAPLIAPALAEAAAGCDLVMPVPLHWRRLAARGFNQSHLLQAHAGRELAIPADRLSLRRRRATAPQTGLDARARRRNLAGAFAVPPRRAGRVAGRRILLVDDVATTGATLGAAAAALREAGAAAVVGFCVARAEIG